MSCLHGVTCQDTEGKFGIEAFASSFEENPGFNAVVKARFADFVVHEVDEDGNLAKLTSLVVTSTISKVAASDVVDGEELIRVQTVDKVKLSESEIAPSSLDDDRYNETLRIGENERDRSGVNGEIKHLNPEISEGDTNMISGSGVELAEAHLQQAREELAKLVGTDAADGAIKMLQNWILCGRTSQKAVTKVYETIYCTDAEPKGTDCLKQKMDAPENFTFPLIDDKETRKSIHLLIRGSLLAPYALADTIDKKVRIWARQFEKQMPNYGKFDSQPALRSEHSSQGRKRKSERGQWPRDRPNFLRFVLYKENLDTVTAAKDIGKIAHMNPRNEIGYAGMKDKRAVTTQFCTVYRKEPSDLIEINKIEKLGRGGGGSSSGFVSVVRVGNFSFVKQQVKLGSLKGNRFDVVLRNVDTCNSLTKEGNGCTSFSKGVNLVLENAAKRMKERGFVNYFGLQRFGKFGDTHKVGISVLLGNFEQAVEIIMRVKPGEDDRIKGARTRWENRFSDVNVDDESAMRDAEKKVGKSVLKDLGRFMICETKLMQSLSRKPRDYTTAFQAVPRTLMLLFLHAVQSYLWNKAASHRVQFSGSKDAVVGDLVLVGDRTLSEGGSGTSGRGGKEVHIVAEEDLRSNRFKITDVVLPLVGSRVIYPSGESGDFIESNLLHLGLSQSSFTQRDKQITLGGDYRKLICKPEDLTWEIKRYSDPLQPLIQTDLMILSKEALPQNDDETSEEKLLGMVIGFTLPPSSYATIALRELMKRSTSGEYQKDLQLDGRCKMQHQIQQDTTSLNSSG